MTDTGETVPNASGRSFVSPSGHDRVNESLSKDLSFNTQRRWPIPCVGSVAIIEGALLCLRHGDFATNDLPRRPRRNSATMDNLGDSVYDGPCLLRENLSRAG